MTLSLSCIVELFGVLLNIQMTWLHARLIKSESLGLEPGDASVQSKLKDSLNRGA